MGNRRAITAGPSGESTGLLVSVWLRNRRSHLLRRFPLMLLFIIFCPIVAAILIMAGAPARKTALVASGLMFVTTLFLLASFQRGQRDFQHVTSFTISPEGHLSFTTGLDGLSLALVLRSAIVTRAPVVFPGRPHKHENGVYAWPISLFADPMRAWAPEGESSAPATAAMVHAGVLKKFGLYGLLRLAIPLLPEGARQWTGLLVVLLLGNIIYVGLVTIAQKRLDWMLGYSSVMHMGYIFLGIASGTLLGTSGAAILIFAHGISIALLFALSGEIRQRTGTLVLEDLGGLGKVK